MKKKHFAVLLVIGLFAILIVSTIHAQILQAFSLSLRTETIQQESGEDAAISEGDLIEDTVNLTGITPDRIRMYIRHHIEARSTYEESFVVSATFNDQTGWISFDEDGMLSYCQVWLRGCQSDLFAVKDIDFRFGGVTVYANLNFLNLKDQVIGIDFSISEDGSLINAESVILGDAIYDFTDTGFIANYIKDYEEEAAQMLNLMRIDIDKQLYCVNNIHLTPSNLDMGLVACADTP